MAIKKDAIQTETKVTDTPPIPQNTQNPTKPASNILKIILIILGVLLLLCALCSTVGYVILKRSKDSFVQRLEDVYPTSVNPNITVTPTSDFLYGSSAKLPEDFPSDVPSYPNAKINVVNTSNTGDSDAKYIVNSSSPDSADKVVDFYKKELVAKGWTIDNETNIFGTVLDAKKSNRTVNMFILGTDGDETTITITVSK